MTATERPRFRTDLVAEPIDDGGLRFIDVLDPDSGNGFRFFEVEYSIACAMDGERDLAGLMRWAREELGVEPSLKEIGTVITTLGDLGYLEGAPAEAAALADDGLELVPGVVVAPRPEPGRFNDDVELGTAGQAPELARTLEAMPVPDEMELGTAGGGRTAAPSARDDFGGGPELGPAGGSSAPLSSHERTAADFEGLTPPPAEMPSASLRPSGRADAEEDGPTNLPQPATMDYEDDEVSVALSDHLAVSASDVKEAVRASKVMAAVDVPSELLEQLEADEARAREEAATAAAAREKIVAEAAQAEAAKEAAAREATLAAREASAREALEREAAVTAAREASAREARSVSDLPEIPVGVSKKKADKEPVVVAKEPPAATPVEAPQRGASRALWLLLLLAIVIAGGYLVWTKVLKKPLPWEPKDEAVEATASGAGKTAAPGPTAVEPPPAPPLPPPVATLAEKAGEVSNIVAGQVAALSFVIADGSQVATGDAVLRFSGNAADEQKMVGFNYDIDKRYPKQIEDATKLRDRPGALPSVVKAQQAKLDEVSKKLEARKVERDALSTKLDALTIKAPIAGVVKLADKVAKGTRTTADQSVASVTAPSSLTATFTVLAASKKVYTADASVRVSVKATPDQKANCTSTTVENLPAGGSTVTVVCPADAGIAPGTEIVLE